MCWEKERCLVEERHPAKGVTQNHFRLFVDFVVIWIDGSARRTVFDEMGPMGVGTAGGRPSGSISYNPQPDRSLKAHARYGGRRSPSP